jgi:hypothetical protein
VSDMGRSRPATGCCIVAWGGCASDSESSRRLLRAWALAHYKDRTWGFRAKFRPYTCEPECAIKTLPVLARYGLRLLKGRPPLADVRSGDPPVLLLERAGGACRGAGVSQDSTVVRSTLAIAYRDRHWPG